MEVSTKGVMIILISLLAVLLIVAGVVSFYTFQSAASPDRLVWCNVFEENGDVDNNINMLFFVEDEDDITPYTDYIFSKKPFDEFRHLFNIYYITRDVYDYQCADYAGGIATFCHSRELLEVAGSCPHDYIAVIDPDKGFSVRSSAYENVMSINEKSSQSVVLHEMGHALAGLAEEYDAGKAPPRGSVNCQGSCSGFDGDVDGCFTECSQSDLIRSVDSGIMRTLSPREPEPGNVFGTFNTDYLTEILEELEQPSATVTGSAISEDQALCSEKEFVIVEGSYDPSGDEARFFEDSKERFIGCAPEKGGAGSLTYSVVNPDGSEDEKQAFTPEFIFTEHQEEGGTVIDGEVFPNNEFILAVSDKDADARSVRIEREGIILAETDIQRTGYRPCLI